MKIMNIFGKKTTPPIEKEPQIKRTLIRGPNGKFISKKQGVPISVTFFGRQINKVYDGKKWYFSVKNILALADPSFGKEKVLRKKTFADTYRKVIKKIDNVVYVDGNGCLRLIREIEGVFPGPLSRWLTESSQFPYETPLKVNKTNAKRQKRHSSAKI